MRLGKAKAERDRAAAGQKGKGASGPAPAPPPLPRDAVLPTFLIVGAMKGGTSSLHWYLDQHPEVYVTQRPHKELHYFDQKPEYRARHRDGYLRHFTHAGQYPARGESTPSYCFVPGAIPAAAEFHPGIKIIMMLRDPVDRAISHIEHRRRIFEQQGKPEGHGTIWEELMEDLRTPYWLVGPKQASERGYHVRGHYHEQVQRIYESLPPEQALILRLEDMQTAPQAELDRVTDFLGVSRHTFGDLTPRNVNQYDRPDPAIYEYLAAYYQLHNQILTRDFGIRTDDWRAPATRAAAAPAPRP